MSNQRCSFEGAATLGSGEPCLREAEYSITYARCDSCGIEKTSVFCNLHAGLIRMIASKFAVWCDCDLDRAGETPIIQCSLLPSTP